MIERLSLLGIGVLAGIIITLIVFRKEIIQIVDYHDDHQDINKTVEIQPDYYLIEKTARLKNLNTHLQRAENGVYPEGYEQTQAEIISALKHQIQALNGCGEILEQMALDIAQESPGLKL